MSRNLDKALEACDSMLNPIDTDSALHFYEMSENYLKQLESGICWGTITQEEAFMALAAFANAEAGGVSLNPHQQQMEV